MMMGSRRALIVGGAIAAALILRLPLSAQDMMKSPLPVLKVVSPGNGAVVKNPVVVVFETPADLTMMTMSMSTAAHLHIDLDKRMTMPSMKMITKVAVNRYRYSFGTAAAGAHTLRVYWADAKTHKPMGMFQTIVFTVR
jgi:hypothetical protein